MRIRVTLFIALLVGVFLLSASQFGLADEETEASPAAGEAVEKADEDGGEASSEAAGEAKPAATESGEKVEEPPIVNKFVAASESGLQTPEVERPGALKATAVGESRFKGRAKSRAMREMRKTAGGRKNHRVVGTTYERNKEKRRWKCIVEYEYWAK